MPSVLRVRFIVHCICITCRLGGVLYWCIAQEDDDSVDSRATHLSRCNEQIYVMLTAAVAVIFDITRLRHLRYFFR